MKELKNIYILIDFSKPQPILPQKEIEMNELEAELINKNFSLNNIQKRYIKK